VYVLVHDEIVWLYANFNYRLHYYIALYNYFLLLDLFRVISDNGQGWPRGVFSWYASPHCIAAGRAQHYPGRHDRPFTRLGLPVGVCIRSIFPSLKKKKKVYLTLKRTQSRVETSSTVNFKHIFLRFLLYVR